MLDLVGPLGHPFPLPADAGRRPCWSAAATAPRRCSRWPDALLARRLAGRDASSARPRADRLFGELVAKRTVGQVTVTTDDGSAGARGRVTDVLPDAIDRHRRRGRLRLRADGDAARGRRGGPRARASRPRSRSRSRWPAASGSA